MLLPFDVQYMIVGDAEFVICMPYSELFIILQFESIGVEKSNTMMPHNVLPDEVEFVIVGRAEPWTCMPCPELFLELVFTKTGCE